MRCGDLNGRSCQPLRAAYPGSKPAIKVAGFSEDDQAALYNSVQGRATAGKKGLGDAGVLRKVAGVKVCGAKRTKFGDTSDDDAGEPDADDGVCRGRKVGRERCDLGRQDGVVVVPPRAAVGAVDGMSSGKAGRLDGLGSQSQEGAAAGAESSGRSGVKEEDLGGMGKKAPEAMETGSRDAMGWEIGSARLKWKRIAVRVLRDSGKGKMKVGRFQKKALRVGGVQTDGEWRRELMIEELMRAVAKSRRVEIKGRHVVLRERDQV